MTVEIHQGDCRDVLDRIEDGSVHCCVTSPPYWSLRDYGVEGQIGLERDVASYVAALVDVFRRVRRVLRTDGTLWLNLDDTYAANRGVQIRGGGHMPARMTVPMGLKAKDLIGIPWRVALALQDDGWFLRSDTIWHKPNAMPESVTDRPSRAHEYVFLFSKSERYHYDSFACREATSRTTRPIDGSENPVDKNVRSVWSVPTESFGERHFVVFPRALAARSIQLGTSEKGCCATCGAPWKRRLAPAGEVTSGGTARKHSGELSFQGKTGALKTGTWRSYRTDGWVPTCRCPNIYAVPCRVLDPFAGAGTVGVVANTLGRDATLIELSRDYCDLIRRRLLAPDSTMRAERTDPAQQKLPGL